MIDHRHGDGAQYPIGDIGRPRDLQKMTAAMGGEDIAFHHALRNGCLNLAAGAAAGGARARRYGWITVAVRLITNASRRSKKSPTISVKASGRSVLIAWPAS